MKLFASLLCFIAAAVPAALQAQANVLFKSDTASHVIYRIPALVAHGHDLVLFTDDRSAVTDATAWGDIGSIGNISIVARTSRNCGRSWSDRVQVVAQGKGSEGFDTGHGDAAVVCDRATGNMLLMCASGTVSYGRSRVSVTRDRKGSYSLDLSNAQKVGRYYSYDGGRSWHGEEVTPEIYGIFNTPSAATLGENKVPVTRLFFGSGRICQSSIIRHGKFHRIYSVLTTNQGSLVLFSDDFGGSWNALGGADARPAPKGDEAKIEELPDGSVLLSCRMMGGRYFNVFRYSDTASAAGEWDEPVASTSLEGGTATQNNACNGEILIVPALDSRGNAVYVALQSTPFGSAEHLPTNVDRRCNVSIYWKVLTTAADFASSQCFATGWTRFAVTDTRSGYSTMVLDAKGNIAFAYEDNGATMCVGSQNADVYDIVFGTFTLREITGGECAFSASKSHRQAFLKRR
ncbi:MAG: sialidase family protein [Bacteroidales bacterium]|nr:sialidase family protein [Bacteroidales bacterium]